MANASPAPLPEDGFSGGDGHTSELEESTTQPASVLPNDNTPKSQPVTRDRQSCEGSGSHVTEIEYYSSEGDIEDDYEDDDDDDDDSSNANFCGRKFDETRYQYLQRVASRQSMQSSASDAFSLPLDAQDDVSSLECDQAGPKSIDLDDVDDISLKEAANDASELKQKSKSPPIGIIASPKLDRSAVSASKILALPIPSLPPLSDSVPVVPLTKIREHDFNKSEGSLKVSEVLNPICEEGGTADYEGGVDEVTKRMHQSLFLPSNIIFQGLSPTRPLVPAIDDATFADFAKTLPPELDFKEARKYIIQLSEGICDDPESQSSDQADENGEIQFDPRLPRTPPPKGSGNSQGKKESLISYDYTEVVEEYSDEEVIEEIIEEEMSDTDD